MTKLDILVFNVGLGQSVFIYPHEMPEYASLIDCGHDGDFHPINFLMARKFVPEKVLHNLTITNFDEDHISGLPHLRNKIGIRTTNISKNLSSDDLRTMKIQPHSDALNHLCHVKDTFIHPLPDYLPPYNKVIFYLEKHHLDNHTTNDLSQIIFIEAFGSVICISGDLEEPGWKALLEHKSEIKAWLARTHVFIASHHGRENGHHAEIFEFCKPECIIISDKKVVHGTQENMSSIYGQYIDKGIVFNNDAENRRKVLTTRSDGHLYVEFHSDGRRAYQSFNHE